MTDMEKAFKMLIVPKHIPHSQYWRYIEERKERQQEEYEIHKQNLDV